MDGTVAELDEDGDIYSWNAKEEEYSDENDEFPFDRAETVRVTSENINEDARMLRKRAEGR
jgi:hypothetical protein